jgi:glucosamine--fructose-6-phosphate aminotransferase (isomerizing)
VCGIIGYTGYRDAVRVIPDCLKSLEYRGYDSAGIAISHNGLKVIRDVGDISNLKKKIPISSSSRFGIGHTRWATHGQVNIDNAHPHVDCKNKIAIVHNGIIENFLSIKEQLKNKGCLFSSNTDSEVIAHLIEKNYKGNLEDALFAILEKLKGSYAIVAMCDDEPGKIVGARKESPLVIGIGDNENFIASDLTALLKYTNRVIFLDDGENCVLSSSSISIFDKNKNAISHDEELINWNLKDAKKSGFAHFMLKEIFEQPQSIQNTLCEKNQ